MISYLTLHLVGPSAVKQAQAALKSAVAFRDGSFGDRATDLARRSCRALMREAAFQWRLAVVPVR